MPATTQVTVNLAEIIGKAAQSTLGVLSLLSLIVGLIAYAFFARSGDRIKLFVFLAILAAAVSFGAAVLVQSRKVDNKEPAKQSSNVPPQATSGSHTNSATSVPSVAKPERTVFVKRVTTEGDEPPDCSRKHERSNLIAGAISSVFQIEFPVTKCKVRLYFDVHATPTFTAPFQIVLFDADEEGNGVQILSATVNKLPNRFELVVGEANPGRWIKMVTTTPSEAGGDAEKTKTTLVGTVDISS